jgi:transcriptional regulator with XRE-family HTH domain
MAKRSTLYSGHKSLVVLGRTVRTIRLSQGMSQEALSLQTELDRSYVGGVERGEHNISFISLQRISDALGLQLAELLSRAEL